jgi:hypothetical protein
MKKYPCSITLTLLYLRGKIVAESWLHFAHTITGTVRTVGIYILKELINK